MLRDFDKKLRNNKVYMRNEGTFLREFDRKLRDQRIPFIFSLHFRVSKLENIVHNFQFACNRHFSLNPLMILGGFVNG